MSHTCSTNKKPYIVFFCFLHKYRRWATSIIFILQITSGSESYDWPIPPLHQVASEYTSPVSRNELQCSSKVVGTPTQKWWTNLTVLTFNVMCWNHAFLDMKSTLSSNIPYFPLPHHAMLGLLEANEEKLRIHHCTGGVGALCKQPYTKCPNSFDHDCSLMVTWTDTYNQKT